MITSDECRLTQNHWVTPLPVEQVLFNPNKSRTMPSYVLLWDKPSWPVVACMECRLQKRSHGLVSAIVAVIVSAWKVWVLTFKEVLPARRRKRKVKVKKGWEFRLCPVQYSVYVNKNQDLKEKYFSSVHEWRIRKATTRVKQR